MPPIEGGKQVVYRCWVLQNEHIIWYMALVHQGGPLHKCSRHPPWFHRSAVFCPVAWPLLVWVARYKKTPRIGSHSWLKTAAKGHMLPTPPTPPPPKSLDSFFGSPPHCSTGVGVWLAVGPQLWSICVLLPRGFYCGLVVFFAGPGRRSKVTPQFFFGSNGSCHRGGATATTPAEI